MEKHAAGRDAEHHPDGTRRVFMLYAVVPDVSETLGLRD
jgi:hypothetical protein